MKHFLVPTERPTINECKRPAKTQSDEGKSYQVGEHRANAYACNFRWAKSITLGYRMKLAFFSQI
jgi:hypothetical protein